ncbi:MAG: efflux RND transporter permease subunit, partial [Paracoccaceae bacterium]|nr:efflux RND transporter permease subunit [Paracoccaceae bacterium]
MTGLIDWAAARARMVLAFVAMTVVAGLFAYTGLPKEGEPDIEIPTLFISVPFPGISATDSEKLLVKTMETELADLDGLKTMSGTALENYAGLMLEFDFGWDKTKIIADVRDAMNTAEGKFPDGAEKYTINEINFSEFPVVVVTLSGAAPERTLLRLAKELQDRLEGLEPVLEATLAGHRDEMVEVLIDPLRLEAYNVTAPELISVVQMNNQLIAAGEVETPGGAFSVKIPSSFNTPADIYALPVKTNGERVVTLGDLAQIRLTFQDRTGTARFNGAPTVALQIVKRKGYNILDTVALVRDTVTAEEARWPTALQEAVDVGVSLDQSKTVGAMVSQLEGSVLTAVALVMIVVLATLGTRSALLVGFSIPTSFLLTFLLLGAMGVAISNIVMFGLILAVGMLVDGAIVIVEYADMRIAQGSGPMRAYTEAARRMFWPVVSSTATTLCAFLPMLFWPGVPGEFMGMLPVTIIFVLSASLVVALTYVPVVGGVAGRISRRLHDIAQIFVHWPLAARLALAGVALAGVFAGGIAMLNPAVLGAAGTGWTAALPGAALFTLATMATSVAFTALRPHRGPQPVEPAYRRRLFGHITAAIAGNPVMPLVTLAAVVGAVVFIFGYYGTHNNGTQFFTDSEVEQGIIYVRARGNLSLNEKDALLRAAEVQVLGTPGVAAVFSFAGEGGLNQNTGGAVAPRDTIGQIQVEMIRWEDRRVTPD